MSAAPGEAVFHVERLVKRYHEEATAVNDVSLSVAGGEIFGLLGANGAGKSTLLKCALGLVRPTSGRLQVDGLDVQREPLEARRRIGYLPEELRLYERLTGWEFLELVCGLKQVECDGAVEEEFRYFGLYERRHELIGEYSLGMRKKTGILAALVGRPKLLLMDEPLNGLDAESMRRLRLRLEARAADGAAVVLSSHVMGFVERVCGRVTILKKGVVAASGTPVELRAQAGLPDEAFDDVFLHFAL
ncbi:MAG: ATP-binding cassette domain-containing protein [Acidobacteria bacterium]|nr:ATP-binding cassette domain-containing protein [Acidobacteriota bacterium]